MAAADDVEQLSAAAQRAAAAAPGGGGLVQRVAARLFSDEFESTVEKFMDGTVQHFADLTLEHIESGENRLEWHAEYERFTAAFESILDEAIAAEGGSAEEFAKIAGDEASLSEDERAVLDLLRASSEYSYFLRLVYDEVQERRT